MLPERIKASKEAISVFRFMMHRPGIATNDNDDNDNDSNDQLEDENLQMIRNQEKIRCDEFATFISLLGNCMMHELILFEIVINFSLSLVRKS